MLIMKKHESVSDEKQFETSNLPLASALIISVPGITVDSISSAPGIDGRRIIVLRYPEDQESAVQHVAEDFYDRRITVPLYRYNRALNSLRDRLKA